MTKINWKTIYPYKNTWQLWGVACSSDATKVFVTEGFSSTTGRVYRSEDSGLTWTNVEPNVTGSSFRTIACSDDGKNFGIGGFSGAFYFVIDPSTTFGSAPAGPGPVNCYDMSYEPAKNTHIAMATISNGIWESNDSGTTITQVTVSGKGANTGWSSISLGKKPGGDILMLVSGFGNGVHLRTASTWSDISPLAGDADKITMTPTGSVFYAVKGGSPINFYKSTNYGSSWTGQQIGSGSVNGLITSDDGNTVFLITESEIKKSTNGGSTWASIDTSFLEEIGEPISFNPWSGICGNGDLSTIYLGSGYGFIYKSVDGGQNWSKITVKTPVTTFPWTSVDANRDNTALVATINSSDASHQAQDNCVFIKKPGYMEWTRKNKNTSYKWNSVAINNDGAFIMATCNPGRAWYSLNFGDTWTEHDVSQSLDKEWCNVSSNKRGGEFYLGERKGRLYRASINGSFTELRPAGNINKDWTCVKSSSQTPAVAACALNDRVYLSTNFGSTWATLNPDGSNQNKKWNTVCISATGQYIVSGQIDGRVYLSKDTGSTWLEIKPAGDIDFTWEKSFISDAGDTILLAGFAENVYKSFYSKDYGKSWEEINVSTSRIIGLSSNNNGQRLILCDGLNVYAGDVVNVKNASFLQDLII